MGPYTKSHNSDAIDDGWTITDGNGEIVAHLNTETMVDTQLCALLGDAAIPPGGYPVNMRLRSDRAIEKTTNDVAAAIVKEISSSDCDLNLLADIYTRYFSDDVVVVVDGDDPALKSDPYKDGEVFGNE